MLVRLSLSLLLAWFWGVREAAAMTACSSGSAAVKYFSLDITSSYAAPDGFARAVYLVNGQSPGPLLNATQGETFAVNVVNRLPIEIGMHWHGLHQEGTPEYDGVPGVNQYAIPPGANVTYCFGTETNYGTYWYHIHLRDIYQDGVRGPILIQPNSSVARPYNKISTVQDDVNAMLQAEQAPVVLMVNDWFHQTSTEIGLRLAVTNDSMRPLCANSILFNGMGSVQCPPSTPGLSSFGCADMSSMGGMEPGNDMKSMSMMPMSMGSSTPMDSSLPMNSSIPGSKSVETSMSTKSSKPNSATSAAGSITMPMGGGTHLSAQSSAMASMSHMTGMATATGPSAQSAMPTTSPSMASLTDSTGTAAMSMAPASAFEIDPADEVCRNTSASRYVVSPPSSNTGDWLMLHLINAGASQQLAFSIDEHDLWVFSADGAFVLPQKVQVTATTQSLTAAAVAALCRCILMRFAECGNLQVVNIGIGQRYGIMIRKPAQPRMQYTIRASTMTHQTYQGTAVLSYGMPNMDQSQSRPWIALDGSPLNSSVRGLEESALQPFPLEEVPKATKEIRLMVNQSQPTVWVLEAGHPFGSNNGQQTPLLFAPRNASGVFWLEKGEVVDILLQISSDSLDNMAHPIHLHGHYFRVLGSAANSKFPTDMTVAQISSKATAGIRSNIKINTSPTAPRRDSAHLPEAGWLALRFAAGNPGVWLLHCHINSHLASGMAVAFIELPNDFPSFPKNVTSPPTIAPLSPIPPLV